MKIPLMLLNFVSRTQAGGHMNIVMVTISGNTTLKVMCVSIVTNFY